jgi:hypothetical protein
MQQLGWITIEITMGIRRRRLSAPGVPAREALGDSPMDSGGAQF